MDDREKARDKDAARDQGPDYDELVKQGKDVMRGRSFAGANYAATERIQTDEREQVAEHGGESLDAVGEVTDAEIEAREERRAERNED